MRNNSHLSVMSNSERTWALTKTGDALKAQEAHEYHHGAETAATWMKISTFVGSKSAFYNKYLPASRKTAQNRRVPPCIVVWMIISPYCRLLAYPTILIIKTLMITSWFENFGPRLAFGNQGVQFYWCGVKAPIERSLPGISPDNFLYLVLTQHISVSAAIFAVVSVHTYIYEVEHYSHPRDEFVNWPHTRLRISGNR